MKKFESDAAAQESEQRQQKIYDKWLKIGLLDDLNEQEGRKCAQFMENCAGYLFEYDKNLHDPFSQKRFLFPITRRVFNKLVQEIGENFWVTEMPAGLDFSPIISGSILTYPFVVKEIELSIKPWTEIVQSIKDMTAFNNLDIEPEICQNLADDIIEQILPKINKQRIVLYTLSLEPAFIRLAILGEWWENEKTK